MSPEEWKEDPEYWELKAEAAEDRARLEDSLRDPWDRELDDADT